MRGRFTLLTALLVVGLVATAGLAQWRMEAVTQQGLSEARARATLVDDLRRLSDRLWQAEKALRQSADPSASAVRQAANALDRAEDQAQSLGRHPWIADHPAAADTLYQLRNQLTALRWGTGSGPARVIPVGRPLSAEPGLGPAFLRANHLLTRLQGRVAGATNRSIKGLSAAAQRHAAFFWLLALAGTAVLWAGGRFFERTIRRPLTQLTATLAAESDGNALSRLPRTQLREARDLAEAVQHMREQVHARKERLAAILDHTAEGVVTFDTEGTIRTFNAAAEHLFGYGEAEIVGQPLTRILGQGRPSDPDSPLHSELLACDKQSCEVTGQDRSGRQFPVDLKVSPMVLAGEQLFTALIADISERKAMFEHLRELAEHDGLTALYNRNFFQQELDQVVADVPQSGRPSALVYVDLDNFKFINDTLGHPAGDRLLVEVAEQLSAEARRGDLLARFGGDEFTGLLFDAGPEEAERLAEAFRDRIAGHRFVHQAQTIEVSCSVGVAVIDEEAGSAEDMLARADFACHLAKRSGRNRVHRFHAENEADVSTLSRDMSWAHTIKSAVENDGLALVCQPIVQTATGRAAAYEVLVRMVDEGQGLIEPGGFLPPAERFGLVGEIDRWVIQRAIAALAERRRQVPDLCYTINLSGHTLSDLATCSLIEEALERTGAEPAALIFEVTETVAIADMEVARRFLGRLQTLGCRTALDDFGSGMCSFGYLQDLPVDLVKIDGQFVRDLPSSEVHQAMVRAMNEIAHSLGKEVIAEFVEDEATYRLLTDFGVDYVQGFHLGRPAMAMCPNPHLGPAVG
jgi:diguanylate cyclase (GGDEF)-like protein/PAS domain S-box-containing protein